MGILSDFVIADASSAQQIGESPNPATLWPTLQSNGVDNIKLATLYCLITGEKYSNDIAKSFALVGGDREKGPWVFEFPSQILRSIAGVDPSRVSGLAETWAATEELRAHRFGVDDAADFICELSLHASRALQSGKSLFLRLAL